LDPKSEIHEIHASAYNPTFYDELLLRPGDVLTFLDEIEADWWRGKCNSKVFRFNSSDSYFYKLIIG
jgi:hypothetical protein